VRHGKGDRSRIVGIDPAAASLLGRWIEVRGARGIPRSAPLFCTLGGRRLHDRYVRALLPRLARRAGIEKRVHPHGLRHTHAAELAREGVPVNVIQAQLGHRSLATTDRYLRHIAPRGAGAPDARADLAGARPGSRLMPGLAAGHCAPRASRPLRGLGRSEQDLALRPASPAVWS
jgi:integrase